MKTILRRHLIIPVIIVFAGFGVQAQDRAVVKGDTIYYAGIKFYKGKVITLGYGSKADKGFAFIWQGSGFAVGPNAPASYSKTEAEVNKFQKGAGKNYIKAKVVGMGSAITIDLEGAVDNKEVLIQ
jgi:hypothetical protein